MKISIVIGGNHPASFVLEEENITSLSFRSKNGIVNIHFKHCGPMDWFLCKQNLLCSDSIWNKGIIRMAYEQGEWIFIFNSKIIPFTISPF